MAIDGTTHPWWKQGVIYHVFPASFSDANNDGVGDLQGIRSKLEYIASLGCKAIRISPVQDSPGVDMGHNVSNHDEIYKPYGTAKDMHDLIRTTHSLGMRVLMDVAVTHTSDQHAWFQESRTSKQSPMRDWYIWRPAKNSPDGARLPPNNWANNFGDGSAWEWDEATQEYYLRLHAKGQPDLNWENVDVRKAIQASALVFWLEQGADGFHVDLVNLYNRPVDLQDAPVAEAGSAYQSTKGIRANESKIQEYLDEIGKVLDRYRAIVVGELPTAAKAADVQGLAIAVHPVSETLGLGKVHSEEPGVGFTFQDFKKVLEGSQDLVHGSAGWPGIYLENHEMVRSVSRFVANESADQVLGAKMLAMLHACLSGTLFIYQGQELGCVNMPADAAQVDSARDHARVPMAWDSKDKHYGFSKDAQLASAPWTETHPQADRINAQSQLHDSGSVLNFWRRMIHTRQQHSGLLIDGTYKSVRPDDPELLVFSKTAATGEGHMLVVLNFSPKKIDWQAPTSGELGLSGGSNLVFEPFMSTHETQTKGSCPGTGVPLSPYEGRMYLAKTN